MKREFCVPIGVQKLCCMDNGKPAAAYIFAVLVENVRLLFPQALGIHALAFGGYPRYLVARCCAIGGILHLQLDLLLDPWVFFPVQAYFCILSPGLASFGVFRLLLRSKVHLIWSMIDSFSSLSLLSPAFGTIISLLFIWG